MARTSFTGPVASANGFITGSATSPITVSTAQNMSSAYGKTTATTGDTRLAYDKLTFASTGSGETIRAFSVVTAANAGTAGTVNGAHISLEVDGSGTISGAGNALRATLGGTNLTQAGTLAVLQVDTNYTGSVTTPATSSYIRFTDSGTGTGKINNLFNIESGPAGAVVSSASGVTANATGAKLLKIRVSGTSYYVLAATSWS